MATRRRSHILTLRTTHAMLGFKLFFSICMQVVLAFCEFPCTHRFPSHIRGYEAMEVLRNRIAAAKSLLAPSRTEGEWLCVSSAQCSAVVSLSKRHKLEAEGFAELNCLAAEVNWHPSHKAIVLAALCAPVPAASHVGRRSLQEFRSFMDFFSKEEWKGMTGASLNVIRRKVMQRLIRLGARCLNERTLKLASSFCLVVHLGDAANTMENLKSELVTFKRDFKTMADAADPPVEYILELPESPAMLLVLHELTYNAAYGADPTHGPVSCQIDASNVRAFDNAVRCRGPATGGMQSHALSLNAPIPQVGNGVNMFMQSLQFMSQIMSGIQGTPFMTGGMNGNGVLGGMRGHMRGEGNARGGPEVAGDADIKLEIFRDRQKDKADARVEAAGGGAVVELEGHAPRAEKTPANISTMLDQISKKVKGVRPMVGADESDGGAECHSDADAEAELSGEEHEPAASPALAPTGPGRSANVLKRPAAAMKAAASKAGAPLEKPKRGRPKAKAKAAMAIAAAVAPPSQKRKKPHFSVEWSRSQIMCRTGEHGPGQCHAIQFGKGQACRTVDAAVSKAKLWVEKQGKR